MKNKIIVLILCITIFLIILDQISKSVIKYKYEEPIEKGIISIHLIENTGIAFGLNNGNTKNMLLTIVILLIVINFIRNQKDRIDNRTAVSLSLILAGGLSNLIDRITRGGIVDFIEIKRFAIFNFADCYIAIGWILLVIFVILYGMSNERISKGEKDCEKQ